MLVVCKAIKEPAPVFFLSSTTLYNIYMEPKKKRALKVAEDDPAIRVARCGVTWSVTLIVLAVFIIGAYQATQIRSVFLHHHREYDQRKRFEQIPGIGEFPFVAHIVEESRRFTNEGLYLPAFARFIEATAVYKFITMDSWTVRIGFFILVIVGMVLTYQYFSNTYWFNKALEVQRYESAAQNSAFAKQFNRGKDLRAAVAAASKTQMFKRESAVDVQQHDDDDE